MVVNRDAVEPQRRPVIVIVLALVFSLAVASCGDDSGALTTAAPSSTTTTTTTTTTSTTTTTTTTTTTIPAVNTRYSSVFDLRERVEIPAVRPVDQVHLLLGANAPDSAFNQALIQHGLQGVNFRQQRLHEHLIGRFVVIQLDVLFTHLVNPSGIISVCTQG